MRKLHRITTILLLVATSLLGLTSCGARSERFPAVDLLIDDLSLFPSEWSIESPPFSARDRLDILMDQGAIDFADVGFAPPNAQFGSPTAGQIVRNFGSGPEAAWEFRRRFQPSDSSFSIEQLGEWSYQNKVADRFRLYCDIRESTPQVKVEGGWTDCIAVGQYDEYISTFNSPVGSEYSMTLADFERILRAIDEKISASLDSHTP